MSTKLTRNNLEALIKVMDSLESIPAEIKQVSVANHTVFLQRSDSLQGGTEYLVVGITNKNPSDPVHRDR